MSNHAMIADRFEIADLFTRFALLLDERRWDDAGTVFTDDVVVHSPRGGAMRGLDSLVDFMRKAEIEGELTQHTQFDVLVELDGDRAAVSANSVVYYFREGEPPHQIGGLRSSSVVVRTPMGWRVSEHEVKPQWIRKD
ncbi:nuclear transport factor 2 family protein [Glycomyces sp. TRM65418]|uniref:nuclear transport factor 2 family protein n=1 Tax=Glycomyces sp. TRM65418 TaxID=2867006 RepID=UPI001CE4F4A5|nr:nuclear transport factor 2 family protein [Glycomyces sp. TRM65418]MCC3764509.1 nuclear transport factor 2 family protein [Glycomyces sp. TRM65418]QZD54179.1 nuclear transport factor 2 family protein [Glycomyces sp. TRM65418]